MAGGLPVGAAGQIVVTNRVEGIPPNGGLVTEIPPKDVINSALGTCSNLTRIAGPRFRTSLALASFFPLEDLDSPYLVRPIKDDVNTILNSKK